MPRRRSRVVKSNLTQILLFSILTLILTAAVVWGGRTWLRNSETLVFAVGEANGPEARFAARLATVLKNNSSRLRLKIVPNEGNKDGQEFAGGTVVKNCMTCHDLDNSPDFDFQAYWPKVKHEGLE